MNAEEAGQASCSNDCESCKQFFTTYKSKIQAFIDAYPELQSLIDRMRDDSKLCINVEIPPFFMFQHPENPVALTAKVVAYEQCERCRGKLDCTSSNRSVYIVDLNTLAAINCYIMLTMAMDFPISQQQIDVNQLSDDVYQLLQKLELYSKHKSISSAKRR